MAQQLRLPETENVKSYLHWLNETSGCESEIGRILYATDFTWVVEDDKNRAEAGLKWRDRYADDIGSELSDVQRDRIRKSIHGKASCYEVILSLAYEIDAMVNEDTEPRTKEFFRILLGNLGLNVYDNEDFDYHEEATKASVSSILEKWMARNDDKYQLFPCDSFEICDKKVSQTASLWLLMNRWVEEHSDENGYFVTEKCHSVTVLK